jgi:hypothetical protein
MISTEAMDKIIDITEKNLQMQGEFLRNLMELRSRFDVTDRDHKDFSDDLKQAVDNTADMVYRMRSASNEKIISMIEKDQVQIKELYTEFCTMCLKITSMADTLTSSDRWSKRFISVVTVVIVVVQSIAIYFLRTDGNEMEELRKSVKQIVEIITPGDTKTLTDKIP